MENINLNQEEVMEEKELNEEYVETPNSGTAVKIAIGAGAALLSMAAFKAVKVVKTKFVDPAVAKHKAKKNMELMTSEDDSEETETE